MEISNLIAHAGYLVSISFFIIAIKRLGKVKTARSANYLAAIAMLLAVLSQLVELQTFDYRLILVGLIVGSLIGSVMAFKVQMTAMPQLVGILNGFGGISSALVALSVVAASSVYGPAAQATFQGSTGVGQAVTLVLSMVIGSITFTGSMIAFLKLSETFGKFFGKPILLPLRHLINIVLIVGLVGLAAYWMMVAPNAQVSVETLLGFVFLSLLLGILLVIPIGGADMPVVISLLNSYSGLAACAAGFALQSNVLIVSGALVGASGMILTSIMCKAMNRSLANVMLGGFGATDSTSDKQNSEYQNVKSADPEEAALDFEAAQSVIIVPGYGLAVAQGQNAVKSLADELKKRGCQVRYAIHPVAGRMPGHMNVLLAESNVPYDELYEMDAINQDFQQTDIALVVGANDVVNPAAKEDKGSPLYGMPVLNVEQARMVFVIKRSLSPGFAGIKNELFEKDNTRMIYGDAKKILEALTAHLKEG